MKVICGLGNPGERYRYSRHNVGFRVVDLLADRWGLTGAGRVREGVAVLEAILPDPIGRVLLVKPMRYMHKSGSGLRVGISGSGETIEHVLAIFKPGERELAAVAVATAADAAERWLRGGIEA